MNRTLSIQQGALSPRLVDQLREQGFKFQIQREGKIAQRLADAVILLSVRGFLGARDKLRLQRKVANFIVDVAGVVEIKRRRQAPAAPPEGQVK